VKRIKIVMQPQPPLKKFKNDETKNGSKKISPAQKAEKKPTSTKSNGSSIEEGRKMFEWLISPEPIDKFMK
jgi:hypothetical protein